MTESVGIRTSMNASEKRATFAIAGIFSTRMLGLFMIFPVFAIFAEQEFADITPLQVGIVMGIYGLTQAFFQVPFGMLSDRLGRKPLIVFGLLIFMLGSMICAVAESVEMMIIGRAIQGIGAVAAVLMASISDLVVEQFRLRAMSIVGMTIGLSFTFSLVAGPVLGEWFGLRGIFWATGILAMVGILLVVFAVPKIENQSFQREAEADPAQFKDVLKNGQLQRLNWGVFALHATLTAMFVVVPLMIRDFAGMDSLSHWELYLPVMLLSFVLMVPFIIQAESKGRMKQVFVGGIAVVALMQIALLTSGTSFWSLFIILMVFFTAFNLLEASLPSLVVKLSPPDKKGTATGVYSTHQFLGAALGGFVGGYLYQYYGLEGLFSFTFIMLTLWFLAAMTMEKPMAVSIASVPIEIHDEAEIPVLTEKLLAFEGVYEAVILKEESRAYFKIDRKLVNEVGLINYIEENK